MKQKLIAVLAGLIAAAAHWRRVSPCLLKNWAKP